MSIYIVIFIILFNYYCYYYYYSSSIERSEDSSLNAAALVLGTGLAVFGFLIYYLLPLSLLSQNFALFFNIFFGILIGLLIGLIILSFNFEHLLERGVVALFFFWEMRSIPQLVLKNLVAHRVRNRKTTLMYALSLGFIIFITVAYTTEIASAKATTMKQEGSNIVVRGRGSHLTYQDVQVLENIIKRNKNAVANWYVDYLFYLFILVLLIIYYKRSYSYLIWILLQFILVFYHYYNFNYYFNY